VIGSREICPSCEARESLLLVMAPQVSGLSTDLRERACTRGDLPADRVVVRSRRDRGTPTSARLQRDWRRVIRLRSCLARRLLVPSGYALMPLAALGKLEMPTQKSSRDRPELAVAELSELLDLQLSPLGLAAIDQLSPSLGETILDIGCGAGQSVRQIADRVGLAGRVIGVDIAPSALALARSRLAGVSQVQLIEADASHLALPGEFADGVFSRFGVMALEPPESAFANFRRMLKQGGRIGFVCWRSLLENELDLLPLRAACLDQPVDGTPFRFSRRDYLEDLLRSTGFCDVEIEALDRRVTSGGLEAMTRVLTRFGPLGRILREQPVLLPRAVKDVRAALAAHAGEASVVSLRAAVWVVTARAR